MRKKDEEKSYEKEIKEERKVVVNRREKRKILSKSI
jgi:hypothetical protein